MLDLIRHVTYKLKGAAFHHPFEVIKYHVSNIKLGVSKVAIN